MMHDDLKARNPWLRLLMGLVALALLGLLTLVFIHLLRPLAEGQPKTLVLSTSAKAGITADNAPAHHARTQPKLASASASASASAQPSSSNASIDATHQERTAQVQKQSIAGQLVKPRVAILVTELGADEKRAKLAIQTLRSEFALAFLPAAKHTPSLAKKARADGHEIWIGLPMQPESWPKISPGLNTMLVKDKPATLIEKLGWALGRIEAPSGAYTMMGSAFTANKKAMSPIARELARRHIILLDSRASNRSIAADSVNEAGGKALSNAVFIDVDTKPDAMRAASQNLIAEAKRKGHAIGIARALPVTIDFLAEWSNSLEGSGVVLVSPGALAGK